jgi:hypothetical protein
MGMRSLSGLFPGINTHQDKQVLEAISQGKRKTSLHCRWPSSCIEYGYDSVIETRGRYLDRVLFGGRQIIEHTFYLSTVG